MFGEIISEITEEPYADEGNKDDAMPPVGNGIYNVLMRLSSDLPNWVPVYGKKICLEYKGMRRQCNNCYGPHIRRYCKSERASIEELASKIRMKYPNIPEEYYGRLAKIQRKVQAPATSAAQASVVVPQLQPEVGGENAHKKTDNTVSTRAAIPSNRTAQVASTIAVPIAVVTEKRDSYHDGNTKVTNEPQSHNQPLRLSFRKDPTSGWLPRHSETNRTVVVGGVAGATETAVSSMLGAIRATFGIGQQLGQRQEEHVVQGGQHCQPAQRAIDGGNSKTTPSQMKGQPTTSGSSSAKPARGRGHSTNQKPQ